MDIDTLLERSRSIWGKHQLNLPDILIRHGVIAGDLYRLARAQMEGEQIDEAELQKELGNIIASFVRWCDDLGYDPNICVEKALTAQGAYAKRLNSK